jgi:hypothetical protein
MTIQKRVSSCQAVLGARMQGGAGQQPTRHTALEDVSTRGVYSPLALVFFKLGAATASRCEGGKLATGILASWGR